MEVVLPDSSVSISYAEADEWILKAWNVSLARYMKETSSLYLKMVNSQYKQSALRVLINGFFSR